MLLTFNSLVLGNGYIIQFYELNNLHLMPSVRFFWHKSEVYHYLSVAGGTTLLQRFSAGSMVYLIIEK